MPELKRIWPPSEAEFQELATEFNVIPVSARLLADAETPLTIFHKLVGTGEGFLLESVEQGQRWSRFSFVGRSNLGTLRLDDSGLTGSGVLARYSIDPKGGIFTNLELIVDSLNVAAHKAHPPLTSGFVGYLGYDTVRELEQLAEPKADDRNLPIAEMSLIGEICAFDHFEQSLTLIKNVVLSGSEPPDLLGEIYNAAVVGLDEMAHSISDRNGPELVEFPTRTSSLPEFTRTFSPAEYMGAVEVAKEFIASGDVFQVVISQRFDFKLKVPAFELYRALRVANPSPYMYFVRTESVEVVGSSPEALVKLDHGRVTTRPIAGTRPRGANEFEDARLAAELGENPKEIAEHIMLVDLARNDVGRVAVFGTEKVDELMTIEKYSSVIHMTSQVSSTLKEGLGPFDVLKATIPAGTVSGSPKVRAMEIIDELEKTRRGPYAGVVGYIDLAGNLDVAIAIRTLFVDRESNAYMQAGAGIVADSDPKSEDEECLNKAKSILSVVASAEVAFSKK